MKQINHSALSSVKCFLVALALLLFAQLAHSQNLVTNAGFDGDASGWSTSCSIEVNPETVYGGSSSSNYVTEIDAERCLNQQVCILPGLSYTFTYKATRRPQSGTPANPGIQVKVTGVNSNTNYVNVSQTYSNTSFDLQTKTYTISVPSNSHDTKLNIQILDYNNTSTYGVLVDDIQLAPAAGNALSIDGPVTGIVNTHYGFSLTNSPSSGVSYSWTFDAGSSPSSNSSASPSNIKWSTAGSKTVSVAVSNSSCTMATYTSSIAITSILPVQMVSYYGEISNQQGLLTWITENENNNLYFAVERSTDGARFDSIGRVEGVNTTNAHTYGFTDAHPAQGNNYYRLRQVDRDGSFTYSKVIVLANEESSSPKMKLSPNPAVATLYYSLTAAASIQARVQVFNLSGVLVISREVSLSAGYNQQSLSIAGLNGGQYFLRVTGLTEKMQLVQAFTKL